MTGDAEANRAIVQEIYSAATNEDLSVLERYLADDCRLIEPAGHPVGRTCWQGRKDFMSGVVDIFQTVGVKALRINEIVADGPFRVIGLLDMVLAGADGAEHVMPMAEVFRIENGLVTEIRAYYFDLVQVNELVGVATQVNGSDADNAL